MKWDVYKSQALTAFLQCLRSQQQDTQAGAAHVRDFRQIELHGSSGSSAARNKGSCSCGAVLVSTGPTVCRTTVDPKLLQGDFQFLHLDWNCSEIEPKTALLGLLAEFKLFGNNPVARHAERPELPGEVRNERDLAAQHHGIIFQRRELSCDLGRGDPPTGRRCP